MAVTNYDLFKRINDFLKKDRRGGVYSELEHQRQLQRMNISYLETLLPFYEKDQDITDRIAKFKKVVNGLTLSSGSYTVPSDYVRHCNLGYRYDGSNYTAVDVLTDNQWFSRLGSSVSTPSTRFPIATYREGNIDFEPITLTGNYLRYTYIRYPVEPYFDGYYDSVTGVFTYMGVGTSKVLGATEYGINGELPTQTLNSRTIELEWDDDDKWIIADMILRDLGIVLNEPLITQYNDQVIKEK